MRVQDLTLAFISALELSTITPAAATNDMVFDILLAKDNLVNQKLAIKIAENGLLVVDAFRAHMQWNQPFDTISCTCETSSALNMLTSYLLADGCFYAFHGWYGGNRVDPCV